MFVKEDKTFDYEKLHEVTKVVTSNLNKIIDVNFYPTEKTRRSNFLHRPIGIGVQGLADAFAMMDIPYLRCCCYCKQVYFGRDLSRYLERSNEISMARCRVYCMKTYKDTNADIFSDSDNIRVIRRM